MTTAEGESSLNRLYWLTLAFGLVGFVSYFWVLGPREGFGFLLGSLGSFGNLWLFAHLAAGLAPGDAPKKPWQAGAFAARYLILFAFGYVIVKALGVNALAVALGLLASTAAVLISSITDLVQSFIRRKPTD